jgi:Ca-activated chloride channel homolog
VSDPGFELETVLRAPLPKPRRQAMEAARRVALQNFDAAFARQAAQTQGTRSRNRLHRIASHWWSTVMTSTNMKTLAGPTLAAALILPIAGVTAYWVMHEHPADVLQMNAAAVQQPNELQYSPPPPTPSAKLEDRLDESGNRVQEKLLALNQLAPSAADSERAEVGVMMRLRSGLDVAREAAPKKASLGPIIEEQIATEPRSIEEKRDAFPEAKSNSVVAVAAQPVSTFSVDVDTSGYSSLRRQLNQGALPSPDAVRIEEMINYFPYAYAGPEKSSEAFRANVTVTPAPWNRNTKLLHVGIKGYDVPPAEQRPSNLVLLLDVSGSMDEPDKLPLVKASFRMLIKKLKPSDTVSIVTYAGNAGVVLEPTRVSEAERILSAIDTLQPGGSTAGEAGINAAYALAERAFVKDGVNRIMLATDGDFNVGAASVEDLKKLVEDKRKSGVFLSVLGFGQGNYQDTLMQTLAQNGNGVAAYIDTLGEAEKVLAQEATSSLFAIAKDVKIQIEFNPARVSEYRLIGYETRHLNNEDFNNDRVDAGDIGSGHTVTAIYEMTPKGAPTQAADDPLRYQPANSKPMKDSRGEYAFVKIRYKLPAEDKSRLVTQPVTDANAVSDLKAAPEDVRFGIAVTAFGQKLRGEVQVANYSLRDVEALAAASRGTDAFGYRGEFLKLVRLANGLMK